MQNLTLSQTCVMAILQALAVVIFIFIVVPLTTFAERKVLGYLQDRLGATRIAGSGFAVYRGRRAGAGRRRDDNLHRGP